MVDVQQKSLTSLAGVSYRFSILILATGSTVSHLHSSKLFQYKTPPTIRKSQKPDKNNLILPY